MVEFERHWAPEADGSRVGKAEAKALWRWKTSRKVAGSHAALVLVIVLLSGCGAGDAPGAINPSEDGNFVLTFTPSDAQVVIEYLGIATNGLVSPLAAGRVSPAATEPGELRYSLAPGRYLVRISKAGFETVEREVVIPEPPAGEGGAGKEKKGKAASPTQLQIALERKPAPGSGPVPGDGSGGARAAFGLRGDPGFDVRDLSAEERLWYGRVWAAIENPDAPQAMEELAGSDELYHYARTLHRHLQSLLLVFRVTGDLRLLDEIDRLSWIMRGELRDEWRGTRDGTDGTRDGYLNWVYRGTGGNSESIWGKDLHKMEEILTHALVASVAYALEVNRDLASPGGRDYGAHADFWKDYLINHFEAKWREREGVDEGLPYLQKDLMHAYVGGLKLHYYLFKLTGDGRYLREAERQADVIWEREVRVVGTPSGEAYVWAHGVLSEGDDQNYLQPTTYARYVFADSVELHFERFDRWADRTEMERLARTLRELIIDGGGNGDQFATNVGGRDGRDKLARGRSGRNDLGPNRGKPLTLEKYADSQYALVSAWDDSGKLEDLTAKALRATGNPERPDSVHLAASMFLDAFLSRR